MATPHRVGDVTGSGQNTFAFESGYDHITVQLLNVPPTIGVVDTLPPERLVNAGWIATLVDQNDGLGDGVLHSVVEFFYVNFVYQVIVLRTEANGMSGYRWWLAPGVHANITAA